MKPSHRFLLWKQVCAAGVCAVAGLIDPHAASAAWPANPAANVPVATHEGAQTLARSISDGAGGVIVAWSDASAASGGIHLQRYSAAGEPQWDAQGRQVAETTAAIALSLARNDAGEILIAWKTYPDSEQHGVLLAQKVDPNGNPLWAIGGRGIHSDYSYWAGDGYQGYYGHDPVVLPGADGGLIVVYLFEDDFDNTLQSARATWLDASGNLIDWRNTEDESPSLFQWDACSDGAGGVVIATAGEQWTQSAGHRISVLAQHWNSNLQRVWNPDAGEYGYHPITVYQAEPTEPNTYPKIAIPQVAISRSEDGQNYHIGWIRRSDISNPDSPVRAWVQKISASGTREWAEQGVEATSAEGQHKWLSLASAGQEAIVSWLSVTPVQRVWAQRLGSGGARLWGGGAGINVGPGADYSNEVVAGDMNWTGELKPFPPRLAWSATDGASLAWHDDRPGVDQVDIVAQRVTPDGGLLFGSEGRVISSSFGPEIPQGLVPDGTGAFYVSWADRRQISANDTPAWSNTDIYAARVPGAGSFLAARQPVHIATNGGGYQELFYYYNTGASWVGNYRNSPGATSSWVLPGQWTGVFHYDYASGAFTQALYLNRQPLQ